MTILHIETSTSVCSVALSHNGECIFNISNYEGANHAAKLCLFVEQALNRMKELNLTPDAVAVSGGPGSYTGLRIGVSTAKGLCYGYNIPLIAVSTLEVMCVETVKHLPGADKRLLCPMIDARRMEVYTAAYDTDIKIISEVTPEIVTEHSFSELLDKHPVIFFGNGSEKCMQVLTHPNAHFIPDIVPLAKNMIRLAEEKFNAGDFADVAYYEPFYLKEFQATTPKSLLGQ